MWHTIAVDYYLLVKMYELDLFMNMDISWVHNIELKKQFAKGYVHYVAFM